VEPLERVLADKAAWVTGVRRSDMESRRMTPIVHEDLLRGVTKVNPIANWTREDVAAHRLRHDLPQHPLADRGYASIGCWPCTKPAHGDDDRSGRWAGQDKTECGLHLPVVEVQLEVSR
jgi:phosphoadenosine phosphosulfate reductase